MKIGIVSLGWPPVWSGGETYLYRIVNALNKKGIDSWGITATPADDNYDSGDDQVIRIVPPFASPILKDTIKMMFQDSITHRSLSKDEQLDRMQIWADMINDKLEEDEFDIGIIYVENLTSLAEVDYRKLFGRPFKKLISLSFDLDYGMYLGFERDVGENQSLLEKIEEISPQLRMMADSEYRNLTTRHYNPEMEGILHLTNFNQDVINMVFGKKKYEFVLHPMMEDEWFKTPISSFNFKQKPKDFVIGIINPIPKKGSDLMLKVIAQTPYQFRILEGGHGNGDIFCSSLQKEYNYTFDDRVDMIHYVEDMVKFFDEIDMLFMPSQIEGYGQVAHESIMRGTPVLTKRFPTIQEATLDRAYFVEPKEYDNPVKWLEGIETIYQGQQLWRDSTLITRQQLIERQHKEIKEFIDFLMEMEES